MLHRLVFKNMIKNYPSSQLQWEILSNINLSLTLVSVIKVVASGTSSIMTTRTIDKVIIKTAGATTLQFCVF